MPTKEELFEKYRDKISAADLEILSDTLPTPAELHQQGAFLEFWGRFKDCAVWAKRMIGGSIVALILLHDCWETYRDFSPYAIKAYDQAQSYVVQLAQHKSEPATRYIFFCTRAEAASTKLPSDRR